MAVEVLPPLLPTPPTSKMPALLLTPPRSKMLPLLLTPCLIVLPASFRTTSSSDPKPGRADSVERWDARKNGSLAASSSSPSRAIPSRADSCERWDNNKRPLTRASSSERWDINKKPRPEEDAIGSGKSNSTSQTTGSEQMISKPRIYAKMAKPPQSFSGPAFFSSPDPCMLPMSAFLVAR